MRAILFLLLLILTGCNASYSFVESKSQNRGGFVPDFGTGPQILVYKTRANYNNLVPVILSDDKSKIVSYPSQSDLKVGDVFLTPDTLLNGYLLDNKGIGLNVAFLKLTYVEYSKLEYVPKLEELYKIIVDKDPLQELCDCGIKKSKDGLITQLNGLIQSSSLQSKCKFIR